MPETFKTKKLIILLRLNPMSDGGYEKIAGFIVVLVVVGAFLWYIGSQMPNEDFAKPFKDVGTIALGGAIALIILIIVVVVIMIYSRVK